MEVKIIAEAGTNHNGRLDLALRLVDIAINAKADYVKFQIINPDSLYVPYYWDGNLKVENKVHQRRKTEVLTFAEWEKVASYSSKKGIPFTASIFDKEGVDFLVKLNVPFIKLASSDLNNIDLIKYISSKNIPLIISTGMATIKEINNSVKAFLEKGDLNNLSILHCVSVYPCSLDKTRLFRIDELKSNFKCNIGFSDHTTNSKAACVAVSKGVRFLEKHYTIDKTMDGFDHKYASSPEEFEKYVSDIRAVEESLNNLNFHNTTGEDITKVRARRGLYLNKALKKGAIISKDDIVALRPSNNFAPSDAQKLIGLELGQDVKEYEPMILRNNRVFVDENQSWKEADDYWVNEMKEKKMLK